MQASDKKIKILFLCTGNSCRSQMAEGFTHYFHENFIIPFSAGVMPKDIDPLAIKVMEEIGIDISNQKSKPLENILHHDFDFVITVCDHAKEVCPVFPKKTTVLHKGFLDPPKLAKNVKSPEEALFYYRKIRDEIGIFIKNLPNNILK